jgi:hypothetical protein
VIDPNHLFTLHRTYTGKGCAMCGQAPVDHTSDDWLVDGVKTPVESTPPSEENL